MPRFRQYNFSVADTECFPISANLMTRKKCQKAIPFFLLLQNVLLIELYEKYE